MTASPSDLPPPPVVEPEICAALRVSSLEQVAHDYSLFVRRFEGLVLVCYDSLRTPRNLLLARQCRGLILVESPSWPVACWPLDRFYDAPAENKQGLLKNPQLRLEEKVDGSQVNLFYSPVHQRWMAATRHTFCEQYTLKRDLLLEGLNLYHYSNNKNKTEPSPKETNDVEITKNNGNDCNGHTTASMPYKTLDDIPGLDKSVTYCLEVCALQNRVVRRYDTPTVYLLAAFHTATHTPVPDAVLDQMTNVFQRPTVYHGEPQSILDEGCRRDPLFEGLVLKDAHFVRQKFKSKVYGAIHKLVYRGFPWATPNFCVPLLIQWPLKTPGKTLLDTILQAVQELRPDEYDEIQQRFAAYQDVLTTHWIQLEDLWTTRLASEKDKAARYQLCCDSGVALADKLLLPHGERIRQLMETSKKPGDAVQALVKETSPQFNQVILKKLFDRVADMAHHGFLDQAHGPAYCLKAGPPTEPGVARQRPHRVRDDNGWSIEWRPHADTHRPVETTHAGWYVECPCGHRMTLVRLQCDRNRYRTCHCGARIGMHTYADGYLLWQCPACGSNHEAHQHDGSWNHGGDQQVFEALQPLGLPATAATKQWRLHVHQCMDKMVRDGTFDTLEDAYVSLAQGLGLQRRDTHMALFDAPQCYRALQLLDTRSLPN